ncbi:uncharacterized protein KY384_002512 [Bacidia gigantensis]|uniref:uncharacterized protein n=1 Tax=Bacidia gigantensis TaxID=2732470 RepID=UPI001D04AFC8|nr:uncharacterized protein KY384_002512 [Bacidia gigantensis]KAG8532635.1 hypothetical protein KY384_002512 [Bacidia gigantensis]
MPASRIGAVTQASPPTEAKSSESYDLNTESVASPESISPCAITPSPGLRKSKRLTVLHDNQVKPVNAAVAVSHGQKRKRGEEKGEAVIESPTKPKFTRRGDCSKEADSSMIYSKIEETSEERKEKDNEIEKTIHQIPQRRSKEIKVEEEISENEATTVVRAKGSDIKTEKKVNSEGTKKIKKKRRTKEEKEADAMPLAARTNGLRMFVGAHVSGAKGVQNSVTNAVHIGGNAFAMFLKSQRKWENPPLQDDHCQQFRHNCGQHSYDKSRHILPHGSYLVNLAQEDTEKAAQAYNAFLDDLKRCEALSIALYNFHPGWTGSAPRSSAISRIASALNRAHAASHTVVPVLEAMAGSGNVIGSTFEDLRDIIDLVENKARIGVCIDTCHIFAAGYDLRSPEAFRGTMQKFDDVVGLKFLKALHINDSKAPLASHRDLHQNIGLGFLGLRAFHNVMNEKRFEDLPLILETPIDHKDENGKAIEDRSVWTKEIKMLEKLIGMDADGEEFKDMEKELSSKGADDRKMFADAFDKKKLKEKKAAEKGQARLNFGPKE